MKNRKKCYYSQPISYRQAYASLLANMTVCMILTGISHFTYMIQAAAIAAVEPDKAILPAC